MSETYRVEYNLRAKADQPAWSTNWHLAKRFSGTDAAKNAETYMKGSPFYSRESSRMRLVRVDGGTITVVKTSPRRAGQAVASRG